MMNTAAQSSHVNQRRAGKGHRVKEAAKDKTSGEGMAK